MTMPHIKLVNCDPLAVQKAAIRQNPQAWAERSTRYAVRGLTLASGFCAVASIAARGHWLQINGQWHRNGL